MKAVVLAGGLGTRLQQRVPGLPKALAPVAGRPFLCHVLDRLIAGGMREIVLALGHRADLVMAHFGSDYGGATLRYSVEAEPLGTGGALANALRTMGDGAALVQNGDTFIDIDFGELLRWYLDSPADAAMVLTRVADVARYGAVLVGNGRVLGFAEKGRHGGGWINAGVYFIHPAVFARFGLSGRFSLEADLLQRHCAALSPRAYLSDAFFIDIGIAEDYERAQRELAARERPPS